MRKIFFLIISLLVGFSSCKKDDNDPVQDLTPKTIELTAKGAEVIATNNEFGIDLFSRTVANENANMMISPLSAGVALTMLLNGCSGETFSQLKSTLKYPTGMTIQEVNEAYRSLVKQLLNADPKLELALANAVFYKSGFNVKAPFLNLMDNVFESKIQGLNFSLPAALQTINKWASDNTKGKIPKVLDEISNDAVMFLMNALYFKGDWSYQFDKTLTADMPFYLNDGSTVNVSTMAGEVGAKIFRAEKFNAVELPYGRTNFTMIVLVPKEASETLSSVLTSDIWQNLTTSFNGMADFGKIEVYMPRFKFSYEKYLNDQLKSMGMTDAFDSDLADLSGISDNQLFVDFVKQNTFVEVNEEGTEAAAVTTIGISLTSAGPPQPSVFVVDRPFIFAIRERTTNTLLFIGQVVNPEYE